MILTPCPYGPITQAGNLGVHAGGAWQHQAVRLGGGLRVLPQSTIRGNLGQ